MSSTHAQLCAKAEAFRRRYQPLLPDGLYARVEAQHLNTTRWLCPVAVAYGPTRVVVRFLLRVLADELMGERLPTLLRGQWVCSLSWNAGFAPSEREVRWAVAEGLERAEKEHIAFRRMQHRALRRMGMLTGAEP